MALNLVSGGSVALILFMAEALEAQGSWVGRVHCRAAGLVKLRVAGILRSFVGTCVVFVDLASPLTLCRGVPQR